MLQFAKVDNKDNFTFDMLPGMSVSDIYPGKYYQSKILVKSRN